MSQPISRQELAKFEANLAEMERTLSRAIPLLPANGPTARLLEATVDSVATARKSMQRALALLDRQDVLAQIAALQARRTQLDAILAS